MALSLSPPVKSHRRHGQGSSPTPSPSGSPRHRRSPSPWRGNHYPNPNSTNFPTSPYHRPVSSKYPTSPKFSSSPKYPSSPKFPSSPTHSNARLSPNHPSSPEHPSNPVFTFPSLTNRSLQCALCLKQYQDARILPCFHTFCASCLEASCLQKGGKRDSMDSVYCPICMETSELTGKGVQGLPRNIYVEHLRELQCSPALPHVTCDLCVSSDVAVKLCEKCGCNLCEFCVHAHQKQRKTSLHQLVNLVQVGGARGVARMLPVGRKEALFCDEHTKLELVLFCKTCDKPMCEECATRNHAHHNHVPLDEASAEHALVLRNLLMQAKILSTSLEESVQNIEYVLSSIQERSEAVSEEIISFVSSHMRALQEHKRSLLLQLDAVKRQKENALMVQATQLKGVLSELRSNCEEATRAIGNGPLESRTPVVSKMEELLHCKVDAAVKEDDYLCFHAQSPAEERNSFPMFGVLDSRGPSAANTTAEGEGLHTAREGKTSQFKVTVHDRFKQRRDTGGDKLVVTMVGSEGEVVHMFVSDSEDGSYVVSYTPEFQVEHTVSVLVGGKHIRGSPFVVSVGGRSSRHYGEFHCCTFCSTQGKKHIRCGCGATMPGGYSGCGHGHPGHPGRRHWSCCGNTVELSECLCNTK